MCNCGVTIAHASIDSGQLDVRPGGLALQAMQTMVEPSVNRILFMETVDTLQMTAGLAVPRATEYPYEYQIEVSLESSRATLLAFSFSGGTA